MIQHNNNYINAINNDNNNNNNNEQTRTSKSPMVEHKQYMYDTY